MVKLCIAVVVLLAVYDFVRCDTKFSLVSPKKVHTGRSFDSLLTVLYDSPADVTVKVTDVRTDTVVHTSSKAVSGNGAVTDISIDIPSNWDGEYKLNVSNNMFNGGVNFKVISVPFAILIQTDKPIYKPSQTVNIRVALIDDNLLPRNETVDVIIEDAEGNKIRQWLAYQAQMGLAQFSLPLSDRPPLGEWVITVSSGEVEQEKTIKIDEYVLPRFEVTVELPSYILKSTEEITAKVTARYTFMEDVIGKLAIVFESSNGEVRKSNIDIKGSAIVRLDLDDVQEIGLRKGYLKATANVFEPLSGKTLNGSAIATIAPSDYNISFMEINSKTYRPGQNYTCYFEVSKPDGVRIKGESNSLQVSLLGAGENDRVKVSVPDTGIVKVSLPMPDSYSVSLLSKLVLENGDIIEGPTTDDLRRFDSINEAIFLQISSNVMGVPQVGDSVDVTVVTSGRDEAYTYVVMSRGRVVTYNMGALSSGGASFTVPITQDFTPQAYVLVYAVLSGELLADSFSFNVDGAFENSVTLEFQDSQGTAIDEAKPADDIKVKVDTEAGSTVGLLSVDKSVLLLGGGNDITQSQILTELMSLVKTSSSCGDDDDDDDDGGFRFFWYPTFGGKSSEDILSNAGLTVATDADLQACVGDYFGGYYNEMAYAYNDDADEFSDVLETNAPTQLGNQVDSPKKRLMFPETWLWDLVFSVDGSLEIPTTVPDTITSWVTTAISMHPTHGLTVTTQSTELAVKLPFFITPILPYSAVKGEEIQVKIIVNNYGDADDTCTVTVAGSDQYEAKESENDIYMPGQDLELDPISVTQSAGSVVAVWVNPRVVDTIQLLVSATCTSGESDAFQRNLLVKPAGYPQEICANEFIQLLPGADDVMVTFGTDINSSYVEDSKIVQIQVTGDVMGPSIEGLDRLVQMPYGCGEQNMITFTPNIFVRRYLDNVNNLNADIKTKTTTYMSTGYQRELTYKHDDGSFSAFGNSDPSGSTWLTAFVVKCFRQAGEYIDIDQNVLDTAMRWLNARKSGSTPGMFNEPGRVLHSEMQGGSSGGITLTAFVVIAMLEDINDNTELSSRISGMSSTISYLENSFARVEANPYQLSIITYALQLAGSGEVSTFLSKLEEMQSESAGEVWWVLPSNKKDIEYGHPDYIRYNGGPSTVEMTSYALLTYIAMNDIVKAKPVANWLTKSRGSSGGFRSTQDTILGLQALSGYAELVISDSTDLQVTFATNEGDTFVHSITADNAIITRKHWFKPADPIKNVNATISGEGSVIVTTCTGYNVMTLPKKPTTSVTTNVTKVKDDETKVTLTACTQYTGEGDSGMGLTQIMLPTGFSASLEDVKRKSGDLARAESTSDGVAVYWNTMTSDDSCVTLVLVQDTVVKGIKDSVVVGSQYYNTESGSRAFFNPSSASIVSDVPEGSNACGITASIMVCMTVLIAHILAL